LDSSYINKSNDNYIENKRHYKRQTQYKIQYINSIQNEHNKSVDSQFTRKPNTFMTRKDHRNTDYYRGNKPNQQKQIQQTGIIDKHQSTISKGTDDVNPFKSLDLNAERNPFQTQHTKSKINTLTKRKIHNIYTHNRQSL